MTRTIGERLRETVVVNDAIRPVWLWEDAPAREPRYLSVSFPAASAVAASLVTLSEDQRILGLRIAPYGVVASHPAYGSLVFEPGAFGRVDPRKVRLRMDHQDPPTGLGRTFDEKADGAYMTFSVAKTQRGDEQLTLARDGVSTGASVGFRETGRARTETRGGRRVTVYGPGSVELAEVSTTWQPTFPDAGVTHVGRA